MKSYNELIDLSRPESDRFPKMSKMNRAAQFAPFAALTGFEALLERRKERVEEMGLSQQVCFEYSENAS